MTSEEMVEAQDTILELMSELDPGHRAIAFSALLESWCPQCGAESDDCECVTSFDAID